ncbi:MAG TPA: OsmC family protein [Acidimicrobiales bacterium]|nr:OsmC family protein [Acidimicrobiales bacterium]
MASGAKEDHVDRDQLRATQAPLKTEYKEDPSRALITLRADGRHGDGEVACSVQTGKAMVKTGLHPATGGDGSLACSGDLLLQALVACAGVTLRSVAVNRGLDVQGSVRAEGDLDFRGTLGVERDVPVGFTAIRLNFDLLTTSARSEEIADLVSTTERYCVVLQTLARAPNITVTSEAGST